MSLFLVSTPFGLVGEVLLPRVVQRFVACITGLAIMRVWFFTFEGKKLKRLMRIFVF